MPKKKYTLEERWELLSHYLNKYGLSQEHDDGRSCLVRENGRLPSHGRACVRVFPDAVTFRYCLPLLQPLTYRAELLEQINDLNERHHWEMTFYIVCGYRGWELHMEGLISYRGCSRPEARRAASLLQWLLGMAERSVYELSEAMPEAFSDAALQKAEEDYFHELSEEDFAGPLEYADALLETYPPEEEPDPEFDFFCNDPAADESMPDWPEEWGDEEALIARYEAEGPDKMSGSDLVRLDLAYKRALQRKKQQLSEALKESDRSNPEQH